MKEYLVTIQLIVKAKTTAEAIEFGLNAAEHLLETFNDNQSIEMLAAVTARPADEIKG